MESLSGEPREAFRVFRVRPTKTPLSFFCGLVEFIGAQQNLAQTQPYVLAPNGSKLYTERCEVAT